MDVDPGSTVPRRQLGRYLRQQRERAKVTVRSASAHLECSTQKLWRIEKGAVPVRGTDVRELCRLYDTPPDLTEVLVSLARQTKEKGWWAAHGDAVPEWFDLYLGLESAAVHIRTYEPNLVPGLLQSHAYMASVIAADRPHLTDDEVQQRIEIRLQRQGLLSRHFPPAPRFDAIVSQAVLLSRPETPGALQQQLWHLVKANELPNVSVRVLPLSGGPHRASVSGAFTILDFPSSADGTGGEPPTVYSESLTGSLYLDRPKELDVYEQAWSALTSRALTEDDSDEMITRIMRQQEEMNR
ncbi:helix-turn-helix domain-containing protein [Actinoplanes sp. NBC_00393]|uniref:helix-turn-helix domain-containing protein n=1 Tax=Actinoplanes sp. NBC_00393 TaxID=2975953 RepID=UPI002E1F87CD